MNFLEIGLQEFSGVEKFEDHYLEKSFRSCHIPAQVVMYITLEAISFETEFKIQAMIILLHRVQA
jgi:hypothetical protein